MKKVAILLPSLPVGGAERLVFEELSYLKNDPRFYFEIHLLFEQGLLYAKFKELEIPIYVWNAPHRSLHSIITYFKIIKYLRYNKFDILHVHLLHHYGPWVGRFAGLKVITTAHIDYKYRLFERFCLRQSDVLFGCGTQVTKNLSTFILGKKLRVLNNAIRPVSLNKELIENIYNQLGLYKDNKVVLSLGRLALQKGYDILIEAFMRVIEKESKAILLIGGEGPDKEKLEQQIKAIGMQKYIRLLGLVNNVNELLEICDVYVNSSRWEGLPMTILEAMANKKPIVATNIGGNSEAIQDRETGLLVPSERPDLLADAILTVLKDEELQNKLGSQAFELFEKNYGIKNHCEILANEYLA